MSEYPQLISFSSAGYVFYREEDHVIKNMYYRIFIVKYPQHKERVFEMKHNFIRKLGEQDA